MIKQTLFFSTPVYLSLKNCQIVISWKDSDDKITRPIRRYRVCSLGKSNDKHYFTASQRVGKE